MCYPSRVFLLSVKSFCVIRQEFSCYFMGLWPCIVDVICPVLSVMNLWVHTTRLEQHVDLVLTESPKSMWSVARSDKRWMIENAKNKKTLDVLFIAGLMFEHKPVSNVRVDRRDRESCAALMIVLSINDCLYTYRTIISYTRFMSSRGQLSCCWFGPRWDMTLQSRRCCNILRTGVNAAVCRKFLITNLIAFRGEIFHTRCTLYLI